MKLFKFARGSSKDKIKFISSSFWVLLLVFIGHLFSLTPKYFASFANAGIDGYINYGVDDNSEITGIPFLNDIPKEKILKSINR